MIRYYSDSSEKRINDELKRLNYVNDLITIKPIPYFERNIKKYGVKLTNFSYFSSNFIITKISNKWVVKYLINDIDGVKIGYIIYKKEPNLNIIIKTMMLIDVRDILILCKIKEFVEDIFWLDYSDNIYNCIKNLLKNGEIDRRD